MHIGLNALGVGSKKKRLERAVRLDETCMKADMHRLHQGIGLQCSLWQADVSAAGLALAVEALAAGTNCENKVTFGERSYAHCSMYRYVHPRTFDSILGMSYAHYPLADQALTRRCIHGCMIA